MFLASMSTAKPLKMAFKVMEMNTAELQGMILHISALQESNPMTIICTLTSSENYLVSSLES